MEITNFRFIYIPSYYFNRRLLIWFAYITCFCECIFSCVQSIYLTNFYALLEFCLNLSMQRAGELVIWLARLKFKVAYRYGCWTCNAFCVWDSLSKAWVFEGKFCGHNEIQFKSFDYGSVGLYYFYCMDVQIIEWPFFIS